MFGREKTADCINIIAFAIVLGFRKRPILPALKTMSITPAFAWALLIGLWVLGRTSKSVSIDHAFVFMCVISLDWYNFNKNRADQRDVHIRPRNRYEETFLFITFACCNIYNTC